MLAIFFSLNGRISRRAYFLGSLFLLVLGSGVWLFEPYSKAQHAYSLGTTALSLWCGSLALPVKRFHDFNMTGLVAPVIYWVPSFFIAIGFMISIVTVALGVADDGSLPPELAALESLALEIERAAMDGAVPWRDALSVYWSLLKASTAGVVIAAVGALAPLLGWLFLCLVPGKPGPNRFGESPISG